ncbi:MAG: class I SAM-dependent methyltransferase [Candidatus Omnitrophota bacterium]|nr:class I SAM-dependent methyltransferase [Candidatus Omnitrophota bacterium]MBU1928471.1 class I SAM-dependent methyltransferase [Candidatus Omnitrophota bacterium]MBU2035456.1 class I SAM-dependent methyltransferase [Candidatus Omnitrophota bacterium]MBU2221898.1 class I SAM-dependent methyltransferase [Candidatus Omnitrophota bacterium]MBU2257536.1 class I SAM-dependent methyltransferase [Candidatus Omnitrophota bacterium]
MTGDCILFAAINLGSQEIYGKRVLEVGSYNVNGSIRPLIEKYNPKEYIGVDISEGPGVDIKCDVTSLISRFGENSFELVVSTELLEHVREWRQAIHNMKTVCKPGGTILITTCSIGFAYHGFPYDYWRYELKDMEYIFGDFKIENLEKANYKGAFIKCVKPDNFIEKDIANFDLYSIIRGRRIIEIPDDISCRWKVKIMGLREDLRYYFHKVIDLLLLSK